MSETIRRRLDAATGAAFAALMIVALLLPGAPPKAEDPVATITALLVEKRAAFLVGSYIAGIATIAYLWFLGAVGEYLRRRGNADYAGAAAAGGVFAIIVTLVGMVMFSGVAFVAARLGDDAVVRAFTDTGNMAIETSKFGFAVFVLAVSRSGAASGSLPRWLHGLGAIAVPLLLVSAVALFVDHGPFQFGGIVDLAGTVPALLWIVGLSVVMIRSPS